MNTSTPDAQQTACEPLMTGSQALLESFLIEGVDTIFGYPGGAIIPVYDALYDYRDRLRHILVRHEQGAVHAAQGYARGQRARGRLPGHFGPRRHEHRHGTRRRPDGLHAAGARHRTGRLRTCSEPTPSRRPTSSGSPRPSRNGTARSSGPKIFRQPSPKPSTWPARDAPGPVVVDITKDAQCSVAPFRYKKLVSIRSYVPVPQPDPACIEEAARLINEAQRPLVMVGQGVPPRECRG